MTKNRLTPGKSGLSPLAPVIDGDTQGLQLAYKRGMNVTLNGVKRLFSNVKILIWLILPGWGLQKRSMQ